jgi:hypothetical protein
MAVDAPMDADTKLIRALSLGFLFGVWRGEYKERLLAGRERKEYGGRLSPKSPVPAACLARVTKVIPPKWRDSYSLMPFSYKLWPVLIGRSSTLFMEILIHLGGNKASQLWKLF